MEDIHPYSLHTRKWVGNFSKIITETPKDDTYVPVLTAWEGALTYYYEFDKFITSNAEAEEAMKRYDIQCQLDSMIKKCRLLRDHTDIVGCNGSLKDNKTSSFYRVMQYLKIKGLPIDKVENDLKQYRVNLNVNKE